MFSHDFCEFPSISVPRRSHRHCHHCLANSPNHLVLLTNCESPGRTSAVVHPSRLPTSLCQLLLGIFFLFFTAPPRLFHLSRQLHCPPAASYLCSPFLSLPLLPPLDPFFFSFSENSKKNICSLLDMEACLRLSVYSGGPVFPGTLHQKSLWLDWFS